MSETTGCAAALPIDYVLRFMKDIDNPDVFLRTERNNALECLDTTNWGTAGKAAILEALQKYLETR